MKFTKEQIANYKKQHGQIFLFESGDKSCILKLAGRNELSLAQVASTSFDEDSGKSHFDANKYDESILMSCWVAGDEEIKTDDKHFLGIRKELDKLVQKSKFTVKEL